MEAKLKVRYTGAEENDKKETAAAPAEGNTTAAVTEAAKTEAETTAAAQTEAGGEKNLVMPSASCVANLNPLLEGYI